MGTGGCVELHDKVRATIAARYRACQRNTLEAAAKAVCPYCEYGSPMDVDDWLGYHKLKHGRACCQAMMVKKLIPKEPAPAGQEQKGRRR